jgi:hypothetical protein
MHQALELGKQANTRGRTIQQLARAFGVELTVLTGEAPIPESKRKDQSASESSIQITAHARNALHLIYERYHIRPWQVVEMAPFLFCWAAEASLRQRWNRIEQVERACRALRDQERQVEYLRISDSDLEEKIEAEKDSIKSRDLFGYQLDDAGFAVFKHEMDRKSICKVSQRSCRSFRRRYDVRGLFGPRLSRVQRMPGRS